ncbi:lactose permease [Pyrenophora tritici-repentis Pt-1C-BFP]|uniref:Lactose permease n=1 Tax=Pyrenophora tritici-repentis (strain Pt-1C-BFP) TaxID=426418 RepID=B2WLA4_PYRTR|nr:lactose permease [Pyrenophora tritici-repentis Pt-1C-BFP]EDU43814.1 lactose permease [Pyrenophora tritici-repentis Pt-1C-BFP]
MVSLRPPKTTQKIVPVKPPKGHFFFAGRIFERLPWWKRPNLRKLYLYIVILIMTNTANGFDGSMMNGLQSLSYWQNYFGEPRGAMLGFFNSSMSLGSLIGLFFTPYLIDWKGRKIGVAIGCCIMLVAVALQTGAQDIGMFIAARLILGFGDTIVLGSAPLLIAEIAHPQDRAVLVTLSGASYHSGAFIASWVTYGTLKLQVKLKTSERLVLASPFPSAINLLSNHSRLHLLHARIPTLLCNKDRHEEALAIFTHWHGEGDVDDEFIQLEYAEVRAAIEFDKKQGKNSWADFLKTKGNRKRITIITAIGFFSQWSGNGLISYYLKYVMDNVGLTNPQTQLGINGGMKTLALVENFTFSFLVDKLGRRPIYLISTIGTFVMFNIFTIISARYAIAPRPALGKGFIASIFLYGVFYDVKAGIMAGYTTEILPYGLRAKGFTWLNFCVTAALFFNQFVNGIALDALAWKYYIVYCVFLAFEIGVIYFCIVETRYTPMEEIAKFFDGDDAVDVGEQALQDMKERGKGIGEKQAVVEHIEVTDKV